MPIYTFVLTMSGPAGSRAPDVLGAACRRLAAMRGDISAIGACDVAIARVDPGERRPDAWDDMSDEADKPADVIAEGAADPQDAAP